MRTFKITQQITPRDTRSLDRYLSDIAKLDLITPEVEIELAKRIREGDTVALEKLVKANLRFVVSVAKQYQQTHLSLNDLISEGNVGLITAAQRFDETRGFKFISYAVWWIRQSILRALNEHSRLVRLPANKVAALSKIRNTMTTLEQTYQREPTAEELAESIEMSTQDVRDHLQLRGSKKSMDAPLGHDSDAGTLHDVMKGETLPAPDRHLHEEGLRTEVKRMMSVLNATEAEVICMYYGLSGGHAASLNEIGDRIGVTSERIRQIKNRATMKLRCVPLKRSLKMFL